MKYLLMIPGPVEIPDDILESIKGQPVAHYGQEWAKLYLETAAAFSRTINSSGRTFIIPGSGSLGLETACATFCNGQKCLVLHNGQFGDRFFHIVSKYSSDVKVLNFRLNNAVDTGMVRSELERKKYDVILMTQVETSTGILNPVEEIGKLSREFNTLFILDAISSVGIEKLEMDRWSVDVTVTASQKGLECPAGLALVTVKQDLLELIKKMSGHSWYTNLKTWCDYYEKWHDWHPYPVTLPTNTIVALSSSLKIIETEGMESRQKMYQEASRRLRLALSALGLELFAPDEYCAHGLTAVSTKEMFKPEELIHYLKEKFGIQITGSFGQLANSVFRIGHMSRKQCAEVNLLNVVKGIALFMTAEELKVSHEKAKRAFLD
jgi:aspartate aminotransferase-like enzyme